MESWKLTMSLKVILPEVKLGKGLVDCHDSKDELYKFLYHIVIHDGQ